MKSQINKIILKNVEDALFEIDIDGMVKEMTNKKKVEEIVRDMVKEKISMAFQEKMLLHYRKQEKIIDAWADNKLTALLIELGVKT